MKLSFLIAVTLAAVLAAPGVANAQTQAQVATTAGSLIATITATEALEVAKATTLPAGVTLTGTVEDLQAPATTDITAAEKTESVNDPANLQESHGWGGWRHGHGHGFGGHGFGKWGHGGFGGFGHHRFGFACGGIGGWAYPLDYWNSFGAGLYGLGGCGLGLSAGGLFYC